MKLTIYDVWNGEKVSDLPLLEEPEVQGTLMVPLEEVLELRDGNAEAKYLIDLIIQWHHDRNLIEGSTDKDQTLKLLQELGELSDNVCKGKDIADDLGDMLVVMINIMVRNNLSITECLREAYNDIKDRKGKMIDGIFVKEA